jgi:hypothetical protein
MSSGTDQARARARILRRLSSQQEQMHDDMAAADKWGADHPDQFAGAWFDNGDAEAGAGPVRLALGVVRGSDPTPIDRLREQLRYPERLVVRACKHSLRELDELRSEIMSRHMPARRGATGTYVSSIGTDVQENFVHITLSTNDEQAAGRLRQEFAARPLKITLGVVVAPVAGRSR